MLGARDEWRLLRLCYDAPSARLNCRKYIFMNCIHVKYFRRSTKMNILTTYSSFKKQTLNNSSRCMMNTYRLTPNNWCCSTSLLFLSCLFVYLFVYFLLCIFFFLLCIIFAYLCVTTFMSLC